ncbi:SPOR domain-containing protein [Pseudoxanthomonas winnipegensis]|uniref:SPOR domain-containing protein n=1 Tax=Pseudoxanthomonas winnipegensis TaxID=2480810 RepID=UPI0030F469E3
MDTALRNRIIGAIVLVALAVIFLPMLIKGPASDSGVSDVSTDVPKAPEGQFETRDLPLVTPGQPGANGASGMPAQAKPATETLTPADAPKPATNAQGLPLATAGGDYAVTFGAYASQADADVVIDRLRQSGLEAFRQEATIGGKPAWRVRVGPYADRAQAEIARLAAVKVRSDVKAEVIALDAGSDAPATAPAASTPPAATPATSNPDAAQLASEAPPAAKPAPAAKPEPAAKPAPTPAKPAAPVESKPPVAAVPKPAATGVGFAVQVGAFGKEADANSLRDKLRGNGFSAFVEPVSTDSGRLFRVRVGPVSTRAEADQLKAQVAARNGLTGIVRPHP